MCSFSNNTLINIKQEDDFEEHDEMLDNVCDTMHIKEEPEDELDTKFSAYNMLSVEIKDENDDFITTDEIKLEPPDVICNIKEEPVECQPELILLPEKEMSDDEYDDNVGNTELTMSERKRLKSWDQDSMIKAVTAIRKREMGFNKAEKLFNVPKTSLRRYVSMTNKTPEEAVLTKSGRKPVFTKSMETELIEYLHEMESRYFGATKKDVRALAFQLAKRRNLTNNFSELRGSAGKDWLQSFLQRHSNKINIRPLSETALSKMKGLCKSYVNAFFDNLESEIQNHGFSPSRIYNVDGTGLLLVQKKSPKLVTVRGKRPVNALTPAESNFFVMVIVCMNAMGIYIPPMMIFPRKISSDHPCDKAPQGTVFSCIQHGWIDGDIFCEWFDHFIYCVKPTVNDPVLLILEGHNNYAKSVDLFDRARANNVSIISVPPHSSNKMQPLEVKFMGALRDNYIREVRFHCHNTGGTVQPDDLPQLFGAALSRTQTPEYAVNGFKTTGIFPINRGIFTEVDFAPDEEEEVFEIDALLEQDMSVG